MVALNPESRMLMQDLQREAGVLPAGDFSQDAQYEPMQVEFPDGDPDWVPEDDDDAPPAEQLEIVHALRDLRFAL